MIVRKVGREYFLVRPGCDEPFRCSPVNNQLSICFCMPQKLAGRSFRLKIVFV